MVEAHAVQYTDAGCAEFLIFTKREDGSVAARVVRMLANIEDRLDVELTQASQPIVH